MTTTTADAPRFETRSSHPALRALAIIGLSAALTAGFLAQAWRTPSAPAADAAIVHCAPGSTSPHC